MLALRCTVAGVDGVGFSVCVCAGLEGALVLRSLCGRGLGWCGVGSRRPGRRVGQGHGSRPRASPFS